MTRLRLSLLAGAAAMMLVPAPFGYAAEGSLYPKEASFANASVAGALGQAGYVADSLGVNEDFNRKIQAAIGDHPILAAQSSQAAIARAETKAARAAG